MSVSGTKLNKSRLDESTVGRVDSYRYAVQPTKEGPTQPQQPKKPRKKRRLWVEGQDQLDNLKEELDMDDHKISRDELERRYGTSIDKGLSPERARDLLQRDGPNELTAPTTTPEWVKLSKQMFGGFSLLLWTAAGLCFAVYSVQSTQYEDPIYDNLYLGLLLCAIVVVTGCFTYYQEVKSSRIMESFKNFTPQFATVIRNGDKLSVHAEELVVGDLIEVKEGDRIPADIRIISAVDFKVDNSVLTGETEDQARQIELTSENPLETKNLAFYSTVAKSGSCRGIVIGTGERTVMGRIASLSTDIDTAKTPISKEIDDLVNIVTAIAVVISLVFFILAFIVGFFWLDAVIFLIGIIIANVPEGLLGTIAVCLTLSARRLAWKNCLVKNMESVESLGATSLIVTDMTGTLTQNKMHVGHYWLDDEIYPVAADSQHNYTQSPTWPDLERTIILTSSEPPQGVGLEDAAQTALLQSMEVVAGNLTEYRATHSKVCEIPFSVANKFCVSVNDTPEIPQCLRTVHMKGAPEKVLERCSTVLVHGSEVKIDDVWREAFYQAFLDLGGIGERCFAFCDRPLPDDQFPHNYEFDPHQENFPTRNLRFLGLVSLIDPPKASVPDAIARCQSAGVKVVMVTGEHPITAKAIAKGLGIMSPSSETIEDIAGRLNQPVLDVNPRDANACVVHGSDLRDMTPSQIDEIMANFDEIVFARTTPQQKTIIIESSQRVGNIVAVTGDGINDAPALKKADIGIAMGIRGNDVSKQAADVIILDDSFTSIVYGVEEGRLVFDNMKKTIAYTLTSCVPEVFPFLLYIIADIPLPISAFVILCIDLGTDLLPAISFAFEKAEGDLLIMKRRPRNVANDRLVNRKMISMTYGQIGMMQVCGGFFMYLIVLAESGFWPTRVFGLRQQWEGRSVNDLEDSYGQEWSYSQRKVLEYTFNSAFFIAIVLLQWANTVACKTRRLSVIHHGMLNWRLTAGLMFAVILADFLIYCPGMDRGLHVYPIRAHWWLAPLPFMFFIFIFDESRKLLLRLNIGGWVEDETFY